MVFSVLLHLSVPAYGAEMVGDSSQEVFFGTKFVDSFYGGDGSDTFVVEHFESEPDIVLDFDPTEGDQVLLKFREAEKWSLDTGRFSINRKGVVSYSLLDKEVVPLINLKRSDLKLKVDNRKGLVYLKFEKKL